METQGAGWLIEELTATDDGKVPCPVAGSSDSIKEPPTYETMH